MRTHGVFLRLDGRRCVVVGGDEESGRKALACLGAGATVTVVAECAPPVLGSAIEEGRVAHHPRSYRTGDLAGATLAYASTRDRDLIDRLRTEAAAEGVLLNVLDVPDACDFFAGAVVERGPVTVLIGTGGVAPAAAAVVRRHVAGALGPEYGDLARVLAAVRGSLADGPARAAALGRLARSRLLDHLRSGDVPAAEREIREITGVACSLDRLGIAVARS